MHEGSVLPDAAAWVSIRARPIGRAMPTPLMLISLVYEVSIRARPIGRAMRDIRVSRSRGTAFQSAPGRLAGRCLQAVFHGAVPVHVSIRARPIGRAMRRFREH